MMKTIIFFAVVLLVFVITAVFAVYYFAREPITSLPHQTEKADQELKLSDENKTVYVFDEARGNIANPSGDSIRFFMVQAVGSIPTGKHILTQKKEGEAKVARAKIKDLMITVISNKTAIELQNPLVREEMRSHFRIEFNRITREEFSRANPKTDPEDLLLATYIEDLYFRTYNVQ
ncbi:MAG: flagellar basal body-associated FliL family protein [Candidatus Poribacteria bacterium]|nr:flagellar basal body-associated FliL family protein [Candidatus Poribacteria bacterium]